jgi:methanogenic corrinoid protein MtbC1
VERLRNRSRSREAAWADLYLKESDPLVVAAELLRARVRLGSWWATADEVGSALHEIGRRWEAGEISVLQEHLASERLARGLQYAGQSIPLAADAPVCLLAMVEGDDHTLGLSLAEVALREAGWGSRWAGRRTPLEDIVRAVHHREVQMVALSASCLSDDAERARRFFEIVAGASRVANVKLVAGGQGAWPEQPEYGHRLKSFGELHRLLRNGEDHGT